MLYNYELQNSGGDVVDGLHLVRRYWLVAHGDCRCDVLTALIPATPKPPQISTLIQTGSPLALHHIHTYCRQIMSFVVNCVS